MELWLKKNENGYLIPVDPDSAENYEKIKTGKEYLFNAKSPRNYKYHKKYFALIKAFVQMQEIYTTIKKARAIILVRAGHCTTLFGEMGEAINIPDSISFASLGEEEFSEVFEASIDACIRLLEEINGVKYSKDDLMACIDHILSFTV